MKHFLLSMMVTSFALTGCVAGGSNSDNGDEDVQVTADTTTVDTAVSEDTEASDTEASDDVVEPTDASMAEDAGSDAAAVEDGSGPGTEDTAVEDTAGDDTAEPLPDAGEPNDVPDVVAGCNADEQEAVQKVNPGVLMQKCEDECGVGQTWCMVECFANATAVSLECGACFGKTYDCIQDSCAGLCDSLTSESCEKCASENGCFDILGECVGEPEPLPPGTLCSPQDIQQVEDGGSKIDSAMAQCIDQCGANDFACIEPCVAEKINISAPCSTCFGMYAACAAFQCGDSCKDFAGPECQTCVETTGCKEQLQLCLDGGPGGGPGGPPNSPDDAECGPDDLDVLASIGPNIKGLISNCWEKCADDDGANCIGKCLQTNTALSAECSQCQGATYQCVYDKCYEQCQVDLDAPECNACVGQSACLSANCFSVP